jgi:hypothetical protein
LHVHAVPIAGQSGYSRIALRIANGCGNRTKVNQGRVVIVGLHLGIGGRGAVDKRVWNRPSFLLRELSKEGGELRLRGSEYLLGGDWHLYLLCHRLLLGREKGNLPVKMEIA